MCFLSVSIQALNVVMSSAQGASVLRRQARLETLCKGSVPAEGLEILHQMTLNSVQGYKTIDIIFKREIVYFSGVRHS